MKNKISTEHLGQVLYQQSNRHNSGDNSLTEIECQPLGFCLRMFKEGQSSIGTQLRGQDQILASPGALGQPWRSSFWKRYIVGAGGESKGFKLMTFSNSEAWEGTGGSCPTLPSHCSLRPPSGGKDHCEPCTSGNFLWTSNCGS